MRILRSGAWLCSCALLAAAAFSNAAHAHRPAVTLDPAVVEAGSPELIRVTAPASAAVAGEWLGQKLVFFRGHNPHAWYALAGVDVKAAVGPSTLRVAVRRANGRTSSLRRSVAIGEAHYRTETLSVAPKFVSPAPEQLKRILAEITLKKSIFAASAPAPLWSGDFRAPVDAPPTDSFGTRRVFNGQLASVHEGMDFLAPVGTPVRASNDGVVVLARPLFFEGNCVILDHGLGLYTISMHLSRIDVQEGERVHTGDRIGLSGATGRVTGPHLHWAVRWENTHLDPAKLLRLHLGGVR